MTNAGVSGHAFYDLRRTFQTVAEGCHDLVAVQAVMGHAASGSDMSAVYRQRVDDSRLLAAVNCVRDWLFAEEAKSTKPAKSAKAKTAKPRRPKADMAEGIRPQLRVVG